VKATIVFAYRRRGMIRCRKELHCRMPDMEIPVAAAVQAAVVGETAVPRMVANVEQTAVSLGRRTLVKIAVPVLCIRSAVVSSLNSQQWPHRMFRRIFLRIQLYPRSAGTTAMQTLSVAAFDSVLPNMVVVMAGAGAACFRNPSRIADREYYLYHKPGSEMAAGHTPAEIAVIGSNL